MKKNTVSLIIRGMQIRTTVRCAGRCCILSNAATIFMRSAVPTYNHPSQIGLGASLEREGVEKITAFSLDIQPLLPTICVQFYTRPRDLRKGQSMHVGARGSMRTMGCWVRTLYCICFGVIHAPVSTLSPMLCKSNKLVLH